MTVQLYNSFPLPQVHALSSFNLTTAVVYSSVRNRSFGFQQRSATSTITSPPCATTPAPSNAPAGTPPTNYDCIQTGANRIVDPVLFVTWYPIPLDAESKFSFSDLAHPGVSLGISLASPSSNYYLGLSHEIVRNVQLVEGFTVAKTTHLAPQTAFNSPPTASAAVPATVQRFDHGWYVGLSFNILGFIQSISNWGGSK